MIIQLYIIFVIPLVLSLLITPLVIRFARKVGAMDQPNQRKIHQYPIPRLGGIAIYSSFFLSLLLYFYLDPALHPFTSMHPHTGVMLVVSLTMVLLLGIWDDMRSLSALSKFAAQCVAASIVYLAGFRISAVTDPFNPSLLHLGYLDFPATVLWIVAITNAFNLIDGLDGLASGVAFIVSLTTCLISFLKGDLTTAMLALILAGSVLGFLRYNFNGARIFLGDSGSLFLGFLLAILSMVSSTKGSTAFSIIVPLLALGLPIMETGLSMIRRFLRAVLPHQQGKRPLSTKLGAMFVPDKGHIHHQLIARGLSHQSSVLLLYTVSCIFGIGAFAVTIANSIVATSILVAIGIATLVGVRQLRYKEMAVLRNGVLLPLYEWPLLNSALFRGFLDLAFIFSAYAAAYFLTYRTHAFLKADESFVTSTALICGIQLLVFYLCGLYKGTFRESGVGDVIKIIKSVILAVVITWITLAFAWSPRGEINATLIVLDFYILLSMEMGLRISYPVLNYFSKREQSEGKKKVLIYGAGRKGSLIVQHILNDSQLQFCPVGFLDDNPDLEGKRVNGYPIFGGHWKLARVLKKFEVAEIIICTDKIGTEVLNRLVRVAKRGGVTIRKVNIQLKDIKESEVVATPYEPQEQFSLAGR